MEMSPTRRKIWDYCRNPETWTGSEQEWAALHETAAAEHAALKEAWMAPRRAKSKAAKEAMRQKAAARALVIQQYREQAPH